jgi:hypothetical protein
VPSKPPPVRPPKQESPPQIHRARFRQPLRPHQPPGGRQARGGEEETSGEEVARRIRAAATKSARARALRLRASTKLEPPQISTAEARGRPAGLRREGGGTLDLRVQGPPPPPVCARSAVVTDCSSPPGISLLPPSAQGPCLRGLLVPIELHAPTSSTQKLKLIGKGGQFTYTSTLPLTCRLPQAAYVEYWSGL